MGHFFLLLRLSILYLIASLITARLRLACGHKSLNIFFRFAQNLYKCSLPRLAILSADKILLRPAQRHASKAVCLLKQNPLKNCLRGFCFTVVLSVGPRVRLSFPTGTVQVSHLTSPSARCDMLNLFDSYTQAKQLACSRAQQKEKPHTRWGISFGCALGRNRTYIVGTANPYPIH